MKFGPSSQFSAIQRAKIYLVSRLGYWAIALIGRSLRWETTGLENLDAIHRTGNRAIFAFWHGSIVPATWYFRDRGIVVMTSMNLDGEMIAACIQRYGYGAARGSSSRSGFRALAEMARKVLAGHDVGFAADGPRGPRHVAKQGPVILARKTGAGIFCFHVALKRKIQLHSWDRFEIPVPFSRARVFAAPAIWIAKDADEADARKGGERVQHVLDDLFRMGEAWLADGRAA